jgi:hypothetical protein
MRQGWVIFSMEDSGELIKPLGEISLREEVQKDTL